jgi:hypothetical protein
MLRRVGAVLAGLAAVVALSIVTDLAMWAAGVFPSPGVVMSNALFLLATAYRTLYGVAGSYLAARLAPDRPMAHAMTLAAIGVLAGMGGVAAAWGRESELGPLWYPLVIMMIPIPCGWVGGSLRQRELRARGLGPGADEIRGSATP